MAGPQSDHALLVAEYAEPYHGGLLTPGQRTRFRAVVWSYYRSAGRTMPWRETRDPYRIMVSEFMLQQTQVSRVEPRYHDFLESFPTVFDLARATLGDVLRSWQGLGYNRRARYLHETAKLIAGRGGTVPDDPAELRTLPGIGAYTAAAVAVFAYERRVVMIETNIRRLFLHSFFRDGRDIPDREIGPLVEQTLPEQALPPRDVRHWYYALMDCGAALAAPALAAPALAAPAANANRRSRHYVRQKPFAGSVREVRGMIIRVLTERGEVSLEELERSAGPTDERFVPALEGLERDGLIVFTRSSISLR